MFRWEPASLNASSLFSKIISVKGLCSAKDFQVQCQGKIKKKSENKKVEIMAKHDKKKKKKYNIRIKRHPNKKNYLPIYALPKGVKLHVHNFPTSVL